MAERIASLNTLSSFLLFLGCGEVEEWEEWEEEWEEGMLAIDWIIWAIRWGWPASCTCRCQVSGVR